MRVTTVSASARFSKALGDGVHKTVELSAEANVEARESWQQAQTRLYQELGQQLKALWTAKGNGNGANGNGEADATPEHFCQEHGVAFKRFEKEGRVWYSHKLDGGKWCNDR